MILLFLQQPNFIAPNSSTCATLQCDRFVDWRNRLKYLYYRIKLLSHIIHMASAYHCNNTFLSLFSLSPIMALNIQKLQYSVKVKVELKSQFHKQYYRDPITHSLRSSWNTNERASGAQNLPTNCQSNKTKLG